MLKLLVVLSFIALVHCTSMSATFPTQCRLLCEGEDEEHEDVIGNLQNEVAQMTDQLTSMTAIINRNRITLCGSGIQDFTIRDDQLSVSSLLGTGKNGDHLPKRARLFGSSGDGHWVTAHYQAGEWIQVDLERDVTVVGVVTQGSYYDYDQYITSYNILYRTDNSVDLQAITDDSGNAMIFSGNSGGVGHTPLLHNFPQPVTARYFRLSILTWHNAPALRFDLLVC